MRGRGDRGGEEGKERERRRGGKGGREGGRSVLRRGMWLRALRMMVL